jgi:hypothetical protein
MAMKLTEIEEEVILLKAIKELIDSMVNFKVLDLLGSDPDSQIFFKSTTHQRFFNIILVDFLSRTDKKAVVQQTSFLGAMKSICNYPCFDSDNSISELRNTTNEFGDWLDQEVEVEAWLPSINTKTTLKLSRICFLKMCGNISKHNFLRSAGPAQELQDMLEKNGVSVGLDDALLVLGDFYERFHTDIFNYHGSTLAEFLNNIRWGIYEYLQPEFQRSIVWEGGDPPRYRYTYPDEVQTGIAKECYWELMNEVRSAPYMRKFEVTKWLKLRY